MDSVISEDLKLSLLIHCFLVAFLPFPLPLPTHPRRRVGVAARRTVRQLHRARRHFGQPRGRAAEDGGNVSEGGVER